MLSFDGEQECGCERFYVLYAWDPSFIIGMFKIAVSEANEPPNYRKPKPTQDKPHRKH